MIERIHTAYKGEVYGISFSLTSQNIIRIQRLYHYGNH